MESLARLQSFLDNMDTHEVARSALPSLVQLLLGRTQASLENDQAIFKVVTHLLDIEVPMVDYGSNSVDNGMEVDEPPLPTLLWYYAPLVSCSHHGSFEKTLDLLSNVCLILLKKAHENNSGLFRTMLADSFQLLKGLAQSLEVSGQEKLSIVAFEKSQGQFVGEKNKFKLPDPFRVEIKGEGETQFREAVVRNFVWLADLLSRALTKMSQFVFDEALTYWTQLNSLMKSLSQIQNEKVLLASLSLASVCMASLRKFPMILAPEIHQTVFGVLLTQIQAGPKIERQEIWEQFTNVISQLVKQSPSWVPEDLVSLLLEEQTFPLVTYPPLRMVIMEAFTLRKVSHQFGSTEFVPILLDFLPDSTVEKPIIDWITGFLASSSKVEALELGSRRAGPGSSKKRKLEQVESQERGSLGEEGFFERALDIVFDHFVYCCSSYVEGFFEQIDAARVGMIILSRVPWCDKGSLVADKFRDVLIYFLTHALFFPQPEREVNVKSFLALRDMIELVLTSGIFRQSSESFDLIHRNLSKVCLMVLSLPWLQPEIVDLACYQTLVRNQIAFTGEDDMQEFQGLVSPGENDLFQLTKFIIGPLRSPPKGTSAWELPEFIQDLRDQKASTLTTISFLMKINSLHTPWITNVFEAAVLDQSASLRNVAFGNLPQASKLDREKVIAWFRKGAEDPSDEVRLVVATNLGLLACSSVGKGPSSPQKSNVNLRERGCPVCDQGGMIKDSWLRDPAEWEPFLSLASETQPSAVRLAMVRSLQRIVTHLHPKSRGSENSIVTCCFSLLSMQDCMEAYKEMSKLLLPLVNINQAGIELDKGNNVKGNQGKLLKMLKNLKANDSQEHILLMVGELARKSDEELLSLVLMVLIDQLSMKNQFLSSVAFEQLREIAKNQCKQPGLLFYKFPEIISKLLVDKMENFDVLIPEFSKAIEMNQKSLLDEILSHVMPTLVEKGEKGKIQQLAICLNRPPTELITPNIHHIMCHLTVQGIDIKQSYGTLTSFMSEAALTDVIDSASFNLKKKLVIELGSPVNSKNAESGLRRLSNGDFQDYLFKESLAILQAIKEPLYDRKSPIELKVKAARALTTVIELMGPKISSVGIQVNRILESLLEENSLVDTGLKAWKSYVQMLESRHLSAFLPQITLALLKRCEELPREVQPIFQVIEDRINELTGLDSLFFLPKKFPFQFLAGVVSDKVSKLSFSDRLQLYLRGLEHDATLVAEKALDNIKLLILQNLGSLRKTALSENSEDVNRLVQALLGGVVRFAPLSPCRRLCCECLGEIGAIDPELLDLSPQRGPRSIPGLESQEDVVLLVCTLIRDKLVPMMKSFAEPNDHDRLSYTIQELLQICKFSKSLKVCSPEDPRPTWAANMTPAGYWQGFPHEVQEIIYPLLDSKYSYSGAPQEATYPIFAPEYEYKQWIRKWAIDLVHRFPRDLAVYPVFYQCVGILYIDEGICLHLLPFLVLLVITKGKEEDAQRIEKEFLAVLDLKGLKKEFLAVLNHKGLKKDTLTKEDNILVCTQTIFSLVDFLNSWVRIQNQSASESRRAVRDLGPVERVNRLLDKIPAQIMTDAALRVKASARALLYYEKYMRFLTSSSPAAKSASSSASTSASASSSSAAAAPKRLNQQMSNLLKDFQPIYASMDEPDGMEGLAVMMTQSSLDQEILNHETAGRWAEAQQCYELAIQQQHPGEQLPFAYQRGLLTCLKNLGHLEIILSHVKRTDCQGLPLEESRELNSFRIEAAWRLGKWEELETALGSPHLEARFEVNLGSILNAVRAGERDQFDALITKARDSLGVPFGVAVTESYTRAYPYMVQLQMLWELEVGVKSWLGVQQLAADNAIPPEWDPELSFTTEAFKIRESILKLRITGLQLKLAREGGLSERQRESVQKEIANCWIQCSKAARKAKLFHTSFASSLNLASNPTPEFYLERAKYHWEGGHPRNAIAELNKALQKVEELTMGGQPRQGGQPKNHLPAKQEAMILLGLWQEQTLQTEPQAIIDKFSEAIALKKSEEAYVHLARFYNKLMDMEDRQQADEKTRDQHLYSALQNYLLALENGAERVYHSMPKFLTLWLDFGERMAARGKTKASSGGEDAIARVRRLVDGSISKLPAFEFLAAFPQIVSRITHKCLDFAELLRKIVLVVLTAYPNQALWQLVSMKNSNSTTQRREVWESISAKVKDKDLQNKIAESTRLCDNLLKICEYKTDNTQDLSIISNFKEFPKTFPNIIVPLQSSMMVALPGRTPDGETDLKNHSPFQKDLPKIKAFRNSIQVMQSLQRPKKVTISGDDGNDYAFLLKPKDDLRKDSRFCEFNSVVNKLFKKDPEARKRRLHIRTFAVLPLNDECGIIEWVPHTVAYRKILLGIYKTRPTPIPTPKECQALWNQKSKRKEAFQDLIKKHPPVFREWLLNQFPEPSAWFSSRLAYIRTTAAISMVGYLVGLGDRHGENILLDEMTGDTVHVDFNCLFEKGRTFEVPEMVPFRLTHNMVDAFGMTGPEGVFRHSCEVSLRVIRENKDTLMSVLETFIYDPLVEWSKKAKPSTNEFSQAATKGAPMEAKKCVNTIQKKLEGFASSHSGLSIEGQVADLITQATNADHLSKMFIGWAPYM